MAVPAFPQEPKPNLDLTITEQPRVLTARFGDGYEQTTLDGLNTDNQSLTISWSPITDTEKDIIISFLRERGATKLFEFTLPDETEPKLWRCPNWSRRSVAAGYWSVQATFERRFEVSA